MRVMGRLSGGAPTIKRYQLSATAARVGIPFLISAAGGAGVAAGTTTSAANFVGVNYDTATYATAQVAGSSPEALVSLAIDTDLILQIFMSGGAASGTAETVKTVTTAATDGLSVTTADSWTSTERDEGAIWGISGANVGQIRKITSTGATSATVTVAFNNDTVVGDTFGWAPTFPMCTATLTLTTELDEFRQDVAVATNTAAYVCIEMRPNDWLGRQRPFGLFVPNDHLLS